MGYKSLTIHISKPITCINVSKSGCRSLQSSCMQNFIKIRDHPLMDLLSSTVIFNYQFYSGARVAQSVGSNNSYKPITNTAWVRVWLCKLQKEGAHDLQSQVIKFTRCLPMVGASLQVLWLPPPLKLVAMI